MPNSCFSSINASIAGLRSAADDLDTLVKLGSLSAEKLSGERGFGATLSRAAPPLTCRKKVELGNRKVAISLIETGVRSLADHVIRSILTTEIEKYGDDCSVLECAEIVMQADHPTSSIPIEDWIHVKAQVVRELVGHFPGR